ncbi:MAG: 3-methyl-2-oxobutanoate hydroxymethyltransferase [Bdellovibrionales bacterium]|jgi:3-methyl-2-oxobutanoate hydroxymethyltransferase
MSLQATVKRMTAPAFTARKGGEKLVCLTAYNAWMARLLDEHVDMLLIGDSMGMVQMGYKSTLPVVLEDVIKGGRAVVENSVKALVVVDMPFGSYQTSPQVAFEACARVMKETGCGAVKLEGGVEMAETVAFLAQRGIPVMGHVGLTPQSVNVLGGYGARGRKDVERKKIMDDAMAITAAGAFSLVIEAVEEPLARKITRGVAIPTIGIGGSPDCDGQILVAEDMLGLLGESGPKPKFVKQYAHLAKEVSKAAATYAKEVRGGAFPDRDLHCYPQVKKKAGI